MAPQRGRTQRSGCDARSVLLGLAVLMLPMSLILSYAPHCPYLRGRPLLGTLWFGRIGYLRSSAPVGVTAWRPVVRRSTAVNRSPPYSSLGSAVLSGVLRPCIRQRTRKHADAGWGLGRGRRKACHSYGHVALARCAAPRPDVPHSGALRTRADEQGKQTSKQQPQWCDGTDCRSVATRTVSRNKDS